MFERIPTFHISLRTDFFGNQQHIYFFSIFAHLFFRTTEVIQKCSTVLKLILQTVLFFLAET